MSINIDIMKSHIIIRQQNDLVGSTKVMSREIRNTIMLIVNKYGWVLESNILLGHENMGGVWTIQS